MENYKVVDKKELLLEQLLEERFKVPTIQIRYHREKYPDLPEIQFNPNGNFVDLYCAEDIVLKAGEYKLISLGVSIKLPKGYWGQIVPRSSAFKHHGVIQSDSFGVVDTSYCGDDDIWMMPVYATRDAVINKNERLCQFRIVKDNHFDIETVDFLSKEENRGGFGTSGK